MIKIEIKFGAGGRVNIVIKVACFTIIGMLLGANQPGFAVQRGTNDVDVILRPQMRAEPLDKPVYRINTASLNSYLQNVVEIANPDDYSELPYITAFAGDAYNGGAGDLAYATGIQPKDKQSYYSLVNSGRELVNPDTQELLGIEAYVIGNAELRSYSRESQSIYISKASETVGIGTRLIPRVALELPNILEARVPNKSMLGYVLSINYQDAGVGSHSTAIIGLGKRDGLERGDLLYLMDVPQEVTDLYTKETSTMKSRKFGEIVIYKVMEKFSLGFVLSATRSVLINDKVIAMASGN
jgi:hypothetical protein